MLQKHEVVREYLASPGSYEVHVLDPSQPDWHKQVDSLREELGAPQNPTLFPPHFLKKTLPSIGGAVMTIHHERQPVGAAFLFPRVTNQTIGYTARLHPRVPIEDAQSLTKAMQDAVGTELRVALYDPSVEKPATETQNLDPQRDSYIHRSQGSDGYTIRALQKKIWGAGDDFLYPADIHFSGFGLPTSFIAYYKGVPVGFVFGFDKFCHELQPVALQGLVGNWHIRQESQLAGVLPEFRGKNIANDLKLSQRKSALVGETEIVNWTVDPLLSENGFLNLNKLGGVVSKHYPDYYAFAGANKLNQVVASRLAVTWFTNSPRVAQAITSSAKARSEKALERITTGAIPILNTTRPYTTDFGSAPTRVVDPRYIDDADTNAIAIEIPINWTAIQSCDVPLATEWRNITDGIFQRYLGTESDRYVLTDAAVMKEGTAVTRAFLVGQSAKQLDSIFLGQDMFTSRK